MNRSARAAVMLTLGAIVARLLWSGGFGWFVQQRMRWPLIAATVVLLVFGVYEVVSSVGEEEKDPEAVRRSAGPTVGWFLLLPVMVLMSVAPTGLGVAAASRIDAYTPTETDDPFEPLDTSSGPPHIRVFDFLERATWDESGSLENTAVRLEGLVVNDPELTDGFRLTRFLVSCCAADGIPLQVHLHGVDSPLADETWVVVDVIWRPPSTSYRENEGDWIVEADVIQLTVVPDAPSDAYESPYE